MLRMISIHWNNPLSSGMLKNVTRQQTNEKPQRLCDKLCGLCVESFS